MELGQRVAQDKDTWAAHHGLVNQERGCSYCGSMHPDEFMQAVRDGYTVGPTDKSYKAYLSETPTDEQMAERKAQAVERYVRMGSSQDSALRMVESDLSIKAGRDVGKFYFQHLSDEQRSEFIELYNNKTMKVGYPGHFYRRPFFAVAATPSP